MEYTVEHTVLDDDNETETDNNFLPQFNQTNDDHAQRQTTNIVFSKASSTDLHNQNDDNQSS